MKNIKSILVSRLRFMGDIILTTPLLHSLRKAYPDATITFLAEQPFISLLENHPDVDKLLPLNRKSNAGQLILYRKLLSRHYDLAIDLFGNPRSALITFLSGARFRIGGNFRGRRHFYTHKMENDGVRRNAIQFHLNYLSPLDIRIDPIEPYIISTPTEKNWANKYLDKKGFDTDKKIVGIHPGATWPAKKWLPERFAELADKLYHEADVQILFTMGPGEKELLAKIIKLCHFDVIQPEALSIRQLAAVLHNLNVFVSNDCGPLHLAPAVGTPTVGIFGPGEPDIWFPYSPAKGHRLVYHNIDCSNCHKDMCEKLDCMKSITVKDVYKAVIDTLHSKDIFR